MNAILPYVDIAIAFVAVMLMATTLVTFLTHFVMFCLSSRRKILEQSIQNLVQKLGLTEQEAKEVKDQVMADPTVKATGCTVVRRERLIEILLDVATRNPKLETALLGQHAKAATTLTKIRHAVLQLEIAEPGLADHIKRTKAIMANSATDGIQKVLGSFDVASDTMTLLLQQHARMVTVILSLVVAILLPLDAITIVKKLAADPEQVSKLVELSKTLSPPGEAGSATADGAVPAQPNSENEGAAGQTTASTESKSSVTNLESKDFDSLKKQITDQAKLLTIAPLGITPALLNWNDYWKRVSEGRPGEVTQTWVGIILAWAMMSLGAPFWFDVLKNLLNLRPALAQREEKERNERATTQAAPAQPAARVVAL